MPNRKKRSLPNRAVGDFDQTSQMTSSQSEHNIVMTPGSEEASSIPLRDTHGLFASRDTIDCSMKFDCVPCAYKVGLFDVALDHEVCQQVPNQRPEQCPRLALSTASAMSMSISQGNEEQPNSFSSLPRIMGYQPGMSVLTVGDGDFSFSLAVARILFDKKHSQSHDQQPEQDGLGQTSTGILIATSYETESTLRRVYPNFDQTLNELHRLGAQTRYQVDATQLQQTFQDSSYEFHRICWNFPCTAIAKGQDGQNQEMEDNKQLVRQFISSSIPLLATDCGEIHICHKTKPPFNQWKLEQVALEGSSNATKLVYAGRIVLDRALLPPYTPRKALDRKSFPCHDACFYVFRQGDDNSSVTNPQPKFLPTLPLDSVGGSACTSTSADYPQRVTPDILLSMRSHCLQRLFHRKKGKKDQKRARHSRYGS